MGGNGEEKVASKFGAVPADTDVVICHGPPRGLGDHTGRKHGQPHVGSSALTETIERVQPRLLVCGHIHSGYGRYRLGETDIVNAALVDNDYCLVNPVVELEL